MIVGEANADYHKHAYSRMLLFHWDCNSTVTDLHCGVIDLSMLNIQSIHSLSKSKSLYDQIFAQQVQ